MTTLPPPAPSRRGRGADPEVALQSILDLFRGVVRLSDLSQTEVDQAIGRRRGYVSHAVNGVVDLKVKDLLAALHVVGVEPREFFAAALRQSATAVADEPAPRLSRPSGVPRTEEELRDLIRDLAQELADPGPPGDDS